MSSKPSHRRIFSAASFLFVTTAGLLWLARNESPSHPATVTSTPSKAQEISADDSEPRVARNPKKHAKPAAERVDSEEIWDFNLGGQPLSITLALDEAMLRDADGKETIAHLNPPATQETLPARLAELSAPNGVFPVAYLAGKERSIATRRIVTPDLRVQLDAAAAEKIASQNQLVIKDRPSYAPGWVVMSAKNPFAALDAMINLRAIREVASADVLLAIQHSLRALPNDPLVTSQWHLKKSGTSVTGSDLNIETAWNYPAATGSRGTGIRIGVVDDGLETGHPDLSPNVDTANDKDWNGNDADPNPGSGDDHGTSCAGNAAAKGNNGIGVSGTAPEATLVGMRLIAAAVTDAQEAEAMTYLPDVIQIKTNSWGPADNGNALDGPGPLTIAALQTAATTGRNGKGSIILWAGGNGGDVSDNSNYDAYANSIYTIAIGATDSFGRRSYYSEPGANLVVCAPSSGRYTTTPATSALGITTVDRSGALGYNSGSTADEIADANYTQTFGGTSSATPSAAGVVALMLEKNPNLGWRDVQEILIRTAVKLPGSTGWVDNSAGFHFNHNFGAGLINATAAVNLAGTWTNLPAQTSATSTQTGLTTTIPNNSSTGAISTFDLSASNIRVEQVTLKLSATHSYRGNLVVTLTSPGGMVSTLSEVHGDTNANYSNWMFSSVRNWGEISTGTWTLKVADLSSTGNSGGGTLTGAELKVFGSPATPVNPAPLAQITQPTDGQVFSPGTPVTVNVTASDLVIGGGAGVVSQVELFDNNVSLGTDTTAPYSFSYSPALGSHSLVAKATDSEAAVGTSVSVNFTVVNQSPVIAAATLSATGQSYSDVPLTVSSVTATDPEGTALTYSYQWQSSVNQTVYSDESGATTDTAPAIAGKLLRCVVTASDGDSSSTAFTTAAVNLLARPIITAATGTAYSYTSGLVLRGTDSALSRRAIINEFSQGPSGSTSEWIEILTLQAGSLAYWDLHDDAGNTLVFLDDPVWDNIPAGTLIVVYNGASKDAQLPADDLNPSDGKMVISSTNPAYFDSTYDAWLPLGNSGDSIFLADDAETVVASVAYGNSTAATPNVGSVGSTKSAYYAGDTDTGANVAANWRVTTSLTARSLRAFLPGVTLSGGTYSQNFNTTPGASGTAYPDGWTSYDGTTADGTMVTGTAASTAGANYNYGSRIGLLGSGSAYEPSSLVLALANTSGATGMSISFDVVKIREQARSMSFKLQYSTTSATAGFTDVPGGAHTSAAIAENTTTSFTSIPLPAAIENSSTTIYLRWLYATATGSGSRDGLALDNVVISTGTSIPSLTLAVTPTTFAENTGASAATGTVSIATALGEPLTVTLGSSDTSEATAPATVTIAAGQTSSPSFAIAAVDDVDSDGPQQVTLTATAAGYADGAAVLTVTDNEPTVEGVTPAAANNAANLTFVNAIRSGSLNSPALFRIGVGATIPTTLVLDPATGVLNGTLAFSNPPGDYLIVIERYNTLGETVSQSYTLTLSAGASDTYAAWISGYPDTPTGLSDDSDHDGLPNGIENILGTAPNVATPGLTQVSATGNTLVFQHTRSNTIAGDLTASYEWSSNLQTWNASGATDGDTTVTLATATLTDTIAPANDLIEVTATITGTPEPQIFVRLTAVKP
ncbi:MAG: S8 family serine peptidase [Verrucomicrobiota bacterium]